VAASISAQPDQVGPLVASGPRWSRPGGLVHPGAPPGGATHPASARRTGRCRRDRRRWWSQAPRRSLARCQAAGCRDGRRRAAAAAARRRRSGPPGRRSAPARQPRCQPTARAGQGGQATPGHQRRTGRRPGRHAQTPARSRGLGFFRLVRWRTRCSRKRARSRSARTPGVGSQIWGTGSRRDSSGEHAGACPVGLARQWRQPLDLGRIRDRDLEAGQLEVLVQQAHVQTAS
jgi:hypothetical protein